MNTSPTKIVTVFGEDLDLFIPAQADRFLMFMGSYGAAARCEWEKEFLLAERIVAQAIYDQTHGVDAESFTTTPTKIAMEHADHVRDLTAEGIAAASRK